MNYILVLHPVISDHINILCQIMFRILYFTLQSNSSNKSYLMPENYKTGVVKPYMMVYTIFTQMFLPY